MVSYETLQELLRQERRSNRVTPLHNGFWARLQAYLREIEDEFREAQARDPFDRKVMMMTDRIKNARHAAEAFWTLRERKLAMIALAHVRDGGEPEGFTDTEMTLYEELTQLMRKGRSTIFAGTAAAEDYGSPPPSSPQRAPPARPARSPSGPSSTEPTPAEATRPAATPPAATPPAATPPAGSNEPKPERRVVEVPPDTPGGDVVLIRALDQIPPFVGPDMQTYHLADGDLATVPKGIADVLVKRKKAAVVDAAETATDTGAAINA